MSITVALAGDTMLGRGVAEHLAAGPPPSLVHPSIVETVRSADLFVLNLECCVSDRGRPWPRPDKPFFFRAPPVALELLRHLGVDCVNLANNHALDFGEEALMDTVGHLSSAGISSVGAGPDVGQARSPVVLEAPGFRLAVLGVTDHPQDFAAGPDRSGVALARLSDEVPLWLTDSVRAAAAGADAVLVTPHWGPNMTVRPVPHVVRAAGALVDAGATLVAGHSAHVFHGVRGPVLFDMGDFLDDYAVDPVLRNDLGLLFLVTLDHRGLIGLEAVPLALDFCFTRPADEEETAWIARRFMGACRDMGTDVRRAGDRLFLSWR